MSSLVSYDLSDGVARLTLNAPDKGNPVNVQGVADLQGAIDQAHADQAKVILLASSGRFFSVGGDLGAFAKADDMPGFIHELATGLHRALADLVRSPAIVVSVVDGVAAGAGFPLAFAADVVLASEKSTFTLGYTKIGLSVDGGSSLLVHSLGLHRVLRLALLNDTATASELEDAGLIARVLPSEELAAAVDEIVAGLAAGARGALANTKRLIREVAETNPEAAMSRETESIASLAGTPDGREGVEAFLAKRRPDFA